VEKRTLFTRPLLEVLGGNAYLVQELLKAAHTCENKSNNCMVMRWMPPDERYHVLQSFLNVVSSLFGPNYVHFNALNGEHSSLFRSTWYCLTVTMPRRPRNMDKRNESRKSASISPPETCTFTDMTRTPRATLRVTLVNESELRSVADGKLCPPRWGFFNARHSERYRVMEDFAKNFQMQLVRTPAHGNSMGHRSPFTSEKAHTPSARPDGGLIKRVQSQPSLAKCHLSQGEETGSGNTAAPLKKTSKRLGSPLGEQASRTLSASADDVDGKDAAEDNCFLRLHVPHFTAPPQQHRLLLQAEHSSAASTGTFCSITGELASLNE